MVAKISNMAQYGGLETNFGRDGPVTQPLTEDNVLDVIRPHNDRWGSRYSVHTLHSGVGGDKTCGDSCRSCMTRIPYATLIATIMCCLGVGVFCATMYRGTTITILMFKRVFNLNLMWIEVVQMVFVVIGACMGALGLILLCLGFLATGATRHKVYRAWRARVGGRISCAIFMGITYVLTILWIGLLSFLVIVTFVFTIFWFMCANPNILNSCIDFTQFYFLFPQGMPQEDMKLCEANKVKLFCRDSVEKAEVMYILATVSCFLVILSLIHYLMCLAANYAHIRDHEKFQELQEIQYLAEIDGDVHASKDRF